jgi:DNA-binding response OmpR family regulator
MSPLVAVVDDDPRIRALLASELEDLGAEVLRCREGSELLADARLDQVQLVLLDWVMPGLDGVGIL